MVGPIKSNLEPIEESDLDLESRIKRSDVSMGGAESKEKPFFPVEQEKTVEVSSAEKDTAYGNILAKVQSNAADDIDEMQVSSDAKDAAGKTDAETQIQHLVDIAMQKGVAHAVKVARHMEDNYVLDSFHDRLLADELHDALIKKGLLGED
jgi:hypothetical protein